MRMFRSIMMGIALLGILGFSGMSTAHAKDTVKLKVAVVYASKDAGKTDSRISGRMAKSLRTAFGQFKSFKLVSKEGFKLKKGNRASIALPTKDEAIVAYVGKARKKHKVLLSIPKHKVKMHLSAPAKKLFYQAGIRHKKGILILAFYLKE